MSTGEKWTVAGVIVGIIGIVIAFLAWIHPFSPSLPIPPTPTRPVLIGATVTPNPTPSPMPSSTPVQTLDTFCRDVYYGRNYQEAYAQFTNSFQARSPLSQLETYTGCSYQATSLGISGDSASVTLALYNRYTGQWEYHTCSLLLDSNNTWRIDNIG